MENELLILDVQKLAVIGTIIASFVGGLTGLLGNWIATMISTRSERKKQLLSIGFETGIRQWETLYKGGLELSERGYKVTMSPPTIYIYYSIRAMELMANGKLTPEALSKLQQEQHELIETIKDFSNK